MTNETPEVTKQTKKKQPQNKRTSNLNIIPKFKIKNTSKKFRKDSMRPLKFAGQKTINVWHFKIYNF